MRVNSWIISLVFFFEEILSFLIFLRLESQWFSNCFSRHTRVLPRKFSVPRKLFKISFFKLSKFPFPTCQNSLSQTVKIFFSKLSKFPFPNCQNFLFQTVKVSCSKLLKFSFPNCQNFLFKLSRPKKFKNHWFRI
jgi:hypothetical protein